MSDDKEGYNFKPWDKRKRVVPIKTWSGRIVHDKPRHFFTLRDVQRISAKVEPAPDRSGISLFLSVLRQLTLAMMDKLLFFLPDDMIDDIYEFCIDMLDRLFRISMDDFKKRSLSRRLIGYSADRVGFAVTIK